MKLSVQTYTVREYLKTQEDIKNSLKKLKSIGYNAIEIAGVDIKHYEYLIGLVQELNMQVCCVHYSVEQIVTNVEKVISFNKRFNAPYVCIGYNPVTCLKDCANLVKNLLIPAKKIKDNGLLLLFHNHAHEFVRENGEYLLDGILNGFNDGLVGVLADFYWIQRAGYSPEKFIKTYSSRVPMVHFKDMRALNDLNKDFQYAEIFEGNMDYESIYNLCLKAGVKWVSIEQDECDVNPFDSLKLSYENLKKRKMFDL